MRMGIIVVYNNVSGFGIIRDSNGEKIRFDILTNKCRFAKLNKVTFQIALLDKGLRAVDLLVIDDTYEKLLKNFSEVFSSNISYNPVNA